MNKAVAYWVVASTLLVLFAAWAAVGCRGVGPSDPFDGRVVDAETRDAGDRDAGDVGPLCGNGVRETTEACDGSDMDGTSCTDYGFRSGGLDCSNRFCTVDLGDCSLLPSCGDGTLDASEACDDGNGVPWDGCTACRVTEYSIVRDDGAMPFWWPSAAKLAVAPDGSFLTFNEHSWCASDFCQYTRYAQRFDRQGRHQGDLADVQYGFDTTDIAAGPDGSYLVVWYYDCVTYARRFLPDGAPVSDAIPLGMEDGLDYCGDLFTVAVTAGASGTWIAVWERRTHPPNTVDFEVVAQILDFDGAPQGAPIPVNQDSSYCQHPAVSADATGNFVVAWQAHDATHETDIYVRRFGADATPAGPELLAQVQPWPGYQLFPDIAVAPSGSFLVVWQGTNLYSGVGGRFFTADGTPDASEIQVNSDQAGNSGNPSVAAAPDSSFVVVWESDGGQDGFESGIFLRRVGADGQPNGSDMQVNDFYLGNQLMPVVATAVDGSLVVVWASVGLDYYPAYPVFDGTIFVQRYDPLGTPLGRGPTIGPGP